MKKNIYIFKKLTLMAFLLFFFTNKSFSQGTAGKDFWIAYMAQDWGCYYSNYYYNNDTPMVFLSSQFNATVVIKAPGQNFTTTVNLVPNVTKAVYLPNTVVCRYSDTVTTNGVNVSSDSIINVYAINRFYYSKGATVVIPSESIVKSPEYVVTTAKDEYNWGWYCNGKQIRSPEFTIVGIADSSVIEIVPTGASSRNSAANVPFQITLKKGQTFQYITTDDDLTGTIVRTKYIESKYGVFAGNRLNIVQRQMPNGGTCGSSWDHTFEQMTPTITWGNNYTALPFKNNPKGYTLKIVAAEHNTIVSINGNYLTTLGQGKHYIHEVFSDTLVRISATNRISVGQFTVGSGYWGSSGGSNCQNHPKQYHGDPSQLQLFPDEQFGNNATINTVSENNYWWWYSWWWNQYKPEHYINIMTKTEDTSDFYLNNKKVINSEWKSSVNFTGYHYAQISIDSGSHYLKSNKGFLSYVYGYSVLEGYAYAAAANFKPIQNNFIITNAQCKRDTTFFEAVLNDSFSNFSWKFGFNNATATGNKVKFKYNDTGWFTVKMFCEHVRTGKKDSVVKSLYIADTKIKNLFNKDTAVCGPLNMVIISKNFDYDNEYSWNDGWPVYYRAIKTPGIYWLDVKERNGCVFRDSLIVANYQFPKARFDVSDTLFCFNKNRDIKINNYSTSIDSISSYVWDYGDGNSNNSDSIHYFKYSKAGYYAIQLRVTTKYGCKHDTFKIIEILKSPKANFEFTKKDTCFYGNGISLKNNTVIDNSVHRRYKWYFSEGFVISNNNPSGIRTYSNIGNYSVNLIYENTNGCIDTMTKNLEIYPHPKADFSFPNTSFCAKDSIQFKASSSYRFPNLTFNWNWGDGNKTLTNDSFVKHSYITNNNFNIKLVTTSIQGCKDSVTKSVFVKSTPNVDFVINNDTQCINNHAFNFINITSGITKNTYQWNFGDGSNSSDSNYFNKVYTKDSSYKVTLTANATNNCQSSTTKTIWLGGYPTSNFSIINEKQCFRINNFNFTNNSNINKGIISSSFWDFGDYTNSSSTNILNKIYSSEDTFIVKLISFSDLGCADTISKKVVVFPQPKANFNPNKTVQCFNQQNFELTNNSSIKSGSMTHNWNFGDASSSNVKDVSKKYSTAGQFLVTLISTSDNNCKDTISRYLTLFESPKSKFNISNDKQCFSGNLFNFTNQSTYNQDPIVQYYWDFGNGFTSNSFSILNYSFATEDTFKINLVSQSNKNCFDTTYSNVITFAQPKAQFSVPKDSQCWQKNFFEINNITTIKYGTLTNNWDFGDNSYSNEFKPSNKIYPNTSGSYIIKYKAVSEHGCSDSAQKRIALLERPISDFNINDSIQCFNNHLFSFENKTTFSAMYSLNYWWDYANGDSSFGILPKTATYSTPNKYNVRLISYSYLTNCYDTIYKQVIAAPHANVDFNINQDSQCFRFNNFVFNNLSTVKFGSNSYLWDFGDNNFDTNTNTNHHYLVENPHLIKLVVTTNYNCKDSTIKNIGFYATPVANFIIDDTIQCFNNHNFNWQNTSTLSKGNFDSKWQFDDNTVSFDKDLTNKTFNKFNTVNYYLSLLSNNGCTDTLFSKIYLEKNNNISINLIQNDSQCLRGNLFDFNVINNNSLVNIVNSHWVYGDGQESFNNIPLTQKYKQDGSFSILLSTISQNGCYDTAKYKVEIHPHPQSEFDVNEVCFPEFSSFSNNSQIKKGKVTETYWDFGDGKSSNQINPLHQYSQHGLYSVLLINKSEFGCLDSIYKQNIALVKQKPKADFDFNKLPTITFEQTRLQFNQKASADANKFYWDFGNNTNSQETNPIGLFEDTGRYNITQIVWNFNNCSDTITKNTGLLMPDFFINIPNAFSPNNNSKNDIFIPIASKYIYKYEFEIYNRWGELVFKTTDLEKGWDGTYKGELCMEGVYMYRIYIVPLNGQVSSYHGTITLLK